MIPYSWLARLPSRSLDIILAGGVWESPSAGNVSAVQIGIVSAPAGVQIQFVIAELLVVVDQSVVVRTGWSQTDFAASDGFVFWTDANRVGDTPGDLAVRSQSDPAAPTLLRTVSEFYVPALTPTRLPYQVRLADSTNNFTLHPTVAGVGIGITFAGAATGWWILS